MSTAGRDTAVFFWATLLLWSISLFFELSFHGRKELSAVVGGFLFYQSASWLLRRSLSRDSLFVNTAVSLLHSTVTSLSVVLILVNQWMVEGVGNMFSHAQLFGGTWPGAYSALCFSCGYFAYDQLDMLRNQLYSGWLPSFLVHHLVVLVCFTLALYRNVTINYLILTLVCEATVPIGDLANFVDVGRRRSSPARHSPRQLHSIFLHIRKLRRMAGFRDAKSRSVQ